MSPHIQIVRTPDTDPAPMPTPYSETADTTLLARVLAEVPFGIHVVGEDGVALFSNPVASAVEGSSGVKFGRRRFDAQLDGMGFAVELSLDETEQHEREGELVRRAFFDDLTQLPNRALIERSVSSLIRNHPGAPFALAFFDLDGFKNVNDYYGHGLGDALLSKVTARLQSHLRPSDILARLSGDEFALMLSPIGELDELMHHMEWLGERIKEPILIDGHEILTSASIGVSLYPEHGGDFETLRANADRAMYRVKGISKGRVRLYDASIEHASTEKARAEQRLRLAIRDRRVCCAYQPKVEIRNGEVAGVEVLMRWRDEDGIIQAPGGFLSLAVELGLMDDLTHFILAETVASIDRINETFGPDCLISLNVAARQAGDQRFMRSLTAKLAESGLARRFMLELTEEAFLSKSEFQTRILPMVREIGARVSIDDFGIGYSSLSALADITADEVKVDRSFITEIHKRPRSQAVLKTIEALGRSLGMTVIVEGVETFEEVAYLQAATQVRYAQGYYFSKPMVLEDVDTRTLSQPARPSVLSRGNVPSRVASQRI